MVRAMSPRWVVQLAACLAVIACLLGGCGVRGSVRLRSVTTGGELTPKLRVLAYRADDSQTADVYLTDLALADLDPGVDPGGLTGCFIHIHFFLMPKAGKTPIESTASSVTIRYVVLARGAIGVYGGGGFLLPGGSPGDSTFGGSLSDATMKLINSNAEFHDPLGPCTLSISFRAPLDESLARRMAASLEDFLLQAAIKPGGNGPANGP